jgi:hypothetical protein
MLLGDLLARFEDETAAEEVALAIGDIAFLASLQGEAEAKGLSIGNCVVASVRRYAAEASDNEWITLIGTMGRSEDPAATFLKRAVAYMRERPDRDSRAHGGPFPA